MSYLWIANDAAGAEVARSGDFGSREDAEAWMGEHWSGLAEEGGQVVVLLEDGEIVYEMGLQEG